MDGRGVFCISLAIDVSLILTNSSTTTHIPFLDRLCSSVEYVRWLSGPECCCCEPRCRRTLLGSFHSSWLVNTSILSHEDQITPTIRTRLEITTRFVHCGLEFFPPLAPHHTTPPVCSAMSAKVVCGTVWRVLGLFILASPGSTSSEAEDHPTSSGSSFGGSFTASKHSLRRVMNNQHRPVRTYSMTENVDTDVCRPCSILTLYPRRQPRTVVSVRTYACYALHP